jgi:flagellar FliL protein
VKLFKSKIVLLVLGLAVGIGMAAGVVIMFGQSLGLTGGVAETKIRYVEKPKVSIMEPMRERIVNLADSNSMRYLKATLVLEMVDFQSKEQPKGEEYTKRQTEMKKEMAGSLPLIDDEITSILTSKSSAELMTPDGKQKLRDELKSRINKAFEKLTPDPKERPEVLSVYFSDFIIQ